MPNGFVSLKQIAGELGMDRSNARKYARKNGFQFHRCRTAEPGRMVPLAAVP
jgi:hypothetical protein